MLACFSFLFFLGNGLFLSERRREAVSLYKGRGDVVF